MDQNGRRSEVRQPLRGAQPPAIASDTAAAQVRAAPPSSADILASIDELPYEWDVETDALSWGGKAVAVLDIADAATIATGRAFASLLAPDTTTTRFDAVTKSERRDEGRGVPYQLEYALVTQSGDKRWLEDTGRWFAGADGRPRRAHGVVRIVSERHEQQEHLAYLSKFDALTGEINRWHLTEALSETLDDAIRCRGSCALLLIAIDNLAHINQAYGFEIADQAIGAVAKRLRAKLRGGDILGRFSGNKFGVILRNCTVDEMAVAAERLVSGIRDDVVQTDAASIALTVTVGGVVAPRHARDLAETLARAQEALDAAKAKRPGSFLAYRPSVEREALRRENLRATDEIVAALNERRILIAFEPVVTAIERQPVLHECLMRIQRADGTLVPASAVIPIAERLGLVRLLDHRVLELVMAELACEAQPKLSLNVSPASTVDPDWWGALAAHLRANSGVAERLTIEITEMAAIHDVDETRGFVARVKDLGCRIAIDDFGAGFTSFRNLRKLGVDIIKIDGAFVQNLIRSRDDRIFVRTLVDLGRALGLTTIAEWVQTEEAAAELAAWGCDCLQGSLIGLASTERPWTVRDAAVSADAAPRAG